MANTEPTVKAASLEVPGLGRYSVDAVAKAYRTKYKRSWSRRLTDRLEKRALRRALRLAQPKGPILDLPCGAGRFAPVLEAFSSQLTFADGSAAMVETARAAMVPVNGVTRSFVHTPVFATPFADQAFDVVVCWRLMHHLAEASDRVRAFRELRRISKSRLIATFSSRSTIKYKLRGIQNRARHSTQSIVDIETIAADAKAGGWILERADPIFSLSSLVTVALFRPDQSS